jgi:hypothetical protein
MLSFEMRFYMTTTRAALSVENLESRLNLSTLPGISIPAAVEIPIYAQERAVMTDHQVVSLSEALGQGDATSSAAAAVDSAQ